MADKVGRDFLSSAISSGTFDVQPGRGAARQVPGNGPRHFVLQKNKYRPTLRAKKIDRYFSFKHIKIYTHLSICYKFYKLCSIASPGHPKPLLLENHDRIVAFTLDL